MHDGHSTVSSASYQTVDSLSACAPRDQPCVTRPLGLCAAVPCRYASNTGLLILNKWLLSSYGFRRPVFLTLCHMLACSVAGYGVHATGFVPSQPVRSPEQFRKIAALACVFCLSVVLGNVALRFIPVSFSQVPLNLLLFAPRTAPVKAMFDGLKILSCAPVCGCSSSSSSQSSDCRMALMWKPAGKPVRQGCVGCCDATTKADFKSAQLCTIW